MMKALNKKRPRGQSFNVHVYDVKQRVFHCRFSTQWAVMTSFLCKKYKIKGLLLYFC